MFFRRQFQFKLQKHLHTFTIFNMKDFYWSIKETLLKNTIQFAAEHADINKNDFEVIFHARKSLLFHSNQPWIERDSDTFDITMGAYDGAEICEPVGIVMLSLLRKKHSSNKNIIQSIILSLQIIIKCNLKIVDYFGVTLNLNDGTYHPFHKPNKETTYIHVESNHPLQIITNIPRSIEKKIIPTIFSKGNI